MDFKTERVPSGSKVSFDDLSEEENAALVRAIERMGYRLRVEEAIDLLFGLRCVPPSPKKPRVIAQDIGPVSNGETITVEWSSDEAA